MAQEYFIKEPHFLQEVGESVPSYKEASASNPRRVVLPDDTHVKTVQKVRQDKKTGLRVEETVQVTNKSLFVGAAPEKPTKAAVAGVVKEPARKSHEPKPEKPTKAGEETKGREADK